MPRVLIHIDATGFAQYYSDRGEIELLFVDERVPRDRVYRHQSHPADAGIIDQIIGSDRVGELGDMPGTEEAIRAALDGRLPSKPTFTVIRSE